MLYLRGNYPQNEHKKQQGSVFYTHIIWPSYFVIMTDLCNVFKCVIMMQARSPQQKRLQKELLALQNDPPPGMTLNEKSVQNTITQ